MRANREQLLENLSQFTGTTQYYRVLPTFVVTDGVKYLMDEAECYWLAELYGLHLVDISFNDEPFTVLKLTRVDEGARIVIEDGNGRTLSYPGPALHGFPFGRDHLVRQLEQRLLGLHAAQRVLKTPQTGQKTGF